eukprot:2283865-Lingulodinium_polyedra.AAC.1
MGTAWGLLGNHLGTTWGQLGNCLGNARELRAMPACPEHPGEKIANRNWGQSEHPGHPGNTIGNARALDTLDT